MPRRPGCSSDHPSSEPKGCRRVQGLHEGIRATWVMAQAMAQRFLAPGPVTPTSPKKEGQGPQKKPKMKGGKPRCFPQYLCDLGCKCRSTGNPKKRYRCISQSRSSSLLSTRKALQTSGAWKSVRSRQLLVAVPSTRESSCTMLSHAWEKTHECQPWIDKPLLG